MANEQYEEACTGKTADPVIIKLGKHKRKAIRKLSRGRGRLFCKVLETHARLHAKEGEGGESAPVFVVVKQKKRKNRMRFSSPWW